MINKENLNNLYEGIINDNELTTKELNSYGFNSKDLSNMIEEGTLTRIKRGYYTLLAVEDLYYYGKKLITKKEHDKATKCFEKCYQLDPEHFGTCFQLFLRSINNKDYENTFKYFDTLLKTDKPHYDIDNNLYLYLLSIITDIPEKHKNYARYLKLEDLNIDIEDKRYEDIPEQNKIRLAIFQRKFPYALKQLKNLIEKHQKLTTQDVIIKILLIQAIEKETLSKNTILELAQTKQYNEIISYLEEKGQRHKLSLNDEYTLKLAKELLSIKETNINLNKTVFQTKNLFEAIDNHNYELALKISNLYNQKNNIDNQENTLNILLSDICSLIEQSTNTLNHPQEESATFSDVIKNLMNSDIEKTLKNLKTYLKSINKTEYEFLITSLIKLSLIEKDIAFTKPMTVLTFITKENFKFDISPYIQEFYISLSENQLEKAKIYLDIISNTNNLYQNNILTENLTKALNKAYKFLNKEPSKTKNTTPNLIKKATPLKKVTEKNKSQEIMENEKKFIEEKHQLLLNGQSIILLKPMDEERRNRIHEMVKKYSDMVSFDIGEENNQQIVLRYKSRKKEFVDVKTMTKSGNQAYIDKNYDECLKCYTKLLQFGTPKAFVYSTLGFTYLKKGYKNTAIDYLTIANHLCKKEQSSYDFSDLINKLKGNVNIEEEKPYFKMELEEFENAKEDYYYDKDQLQEITLYSLGANLDVESACQKLGMNEEQIDIIRLMYAKEYYAQGDYTQGDKFLKVVEQSQHKTENTKKLLDEIRTNKKFYINRANPKSSRLTLSLKPKK